MRLFLDTTVILAASGSAVGASSEIFRRASANHWILVSTPYVLEEVLRNLPDLAPAASAAWATLRPQLLIMDDVFTVDRPAVFSVTKDRPILFSALAWTDILLTLDVGDFASFMERPFYELLVFRPGVFLQRERTAGRLL